MVSRIYSQLNIYRTKYVTASVAILLVSLVLAASAAPFQHRNSHKLRATALVELTTDAGGRVTPHVYPITILADGTFRDASIYESRPRPMALGNGIVYEVQKTGVPTGYVTITTGGHTLEGWVAEGRWQPAGQVQAKATPKPAQTQSPADDRPILHREGENPPSAAPAPAPESAPSAPSDDRPVLHRSDSSQPSSSGSQPASQPDNSPVTPTDSAPPDPDRPTLRRRQPSAADKPDVTPSPVVTKTPAAPTQGAPVTALAPGTQILVAVSDAQSSDTRSFEFRWKPGEKEQIEAKMRKLAVAQLPGENAQANEHALTNVVIRGFDLDLSNDAVVVITAEVPGGYLAPAGKTTAAAPASSQNQKFVSRYIAVIARVDIDGNPQKLAASVTDSTRLDVAPRLELIDAVDVDGDGLAELLFREYDFDQKSFIIYGVGHGTVTKVFEGASEPLHH